MKLILAKMLSAWYHRNDKYGSNSYYDYHIKGVDKLVDSILSDNIEKKHYRVVAYLHDVVEDHAVSMKLIRFLFGEEVAEAVDAISKREGEFYSDYIQRCLENKIASIVKYCDAMFNAKNCYEDKDDERLEKYLMVCSVISQEYVIDEV